MRTSKNSIKLNISLKSRLQRSSNRQQVLQLFHYRNDYCDTSTPSKPANYNFVSHEAQVTFIIDNGMKVQDNESRSYRTLMLKNHKVIEYYGIRYYIPTCEKHTEDQKIVQYLLDHFQVEISKPEMNEEFNISNDIIKKEDSSKKYLNLKHVNTPSYTFEEQGTVIYQVEFDENEIAS